MKKDKITMESAIKIVENGGYLAKDIDGYLFMCRPIGEEKEFSFSFKDSKSPGKAVFIGVFEPGQAVRYIEVMAAIENGLVKKKNVKKRGVCYER